MNLRNCRVLRVLATAVAISCLSLPGSPACAQQDLVRGFENPPASARLRCYWWWLNGNTTEEAIDRDLREMHDKGYGGAILVDANGAEQRGGQPVPAGPTFGSPDWTKLYLHALATAQKYDLEISLNIMSGWNLGGPLVTPDKASKVLTWSRAVLEPGSPETTTLSQPQANLGFYRDIAILAYPLHHGAPIPGEPGAKDRAAISKLQEKGAFVEAGFSAPDTRPLLIDSPVQPGEEDAKLAEVLDLSNKLDSEGKLHWHPASGEWEVLRIGYKASGAVTSTSSGVWQGLAIDYLDHEAFDFYWNRAVEPLLQAAKPYLGTTLKYLVTDSWELGGTNWSPRFREEFKQRRGYDPLPYLPIVSGRIIEDRDTSNRFLADLRRTVADLISTEHYDYFAKRAAAHGLGIHPESGGPHGAPIDALETFRSASFPQTEYWAKSRTHRTSDQDRFFLKEASSAAHIYGQKIVAAEGMTSIGPHWNESLGDNLKHSFDQALTEGMNRLIWHTFTSSPQSMGKPGQEYFAGTHLNPNVTWWPVAGALTSYINRAEYLLQQGDPVADVLYYYGDHAPNFVRVKTDDPAHVLPGYDYDVVDQDVLLKLHVEEGRITTPRGMHYRVLVLPDTKTVSPEALKAIAALIKAGAIVAGPKPIRTTGLLNGKIQDQELSTLAATIWGDCQEKETREHIYGAGTVYCTENTREVLAANRIPEDFSYLSPDAKVKLDYIHRTAGSTDIYFVRNPEGHAIRTDVTLRVTNKQPELWDPATGQMVAQPIYRTTTDGRTLLPLWLDPYGSIFILLRKPAATHIVSLQRDGVPIFPHSVTWNNDDAPIHASLFKESLQLSSAAGGHYIAELSNHATSSAELTAANTSSISSSWTLTFPSGWGAPDHVQIDRLKSWTDFADSGIRYFSGTATYQTSFELSEAEIKGKRIPMLDLGEIHEIAAVRVNGHAVGILWKRPYRMEIPGILKVGTNRLEIEITNFWPNRIIGDAQPDAGKHYTQTNVRAYSKDSPLLPSGLLGPVKIEWLENSNTHK